MKISKKLHFIGGRVTKTGISVFITALICHWLNWPAMFAVITAIVTIEPTADDSIKKAFIRFPASAIGAAFAVLFTFQFGDIPLTYTLVSLLTIIFCHKLHLQEGMLVATLTGVAMISTVHDHYLSSFFIRLGTTTTGLTVSSLVNILVIPPRYVNTIVEKNDALFTNAGNLFYKIGLEIINDRPSNLKSVHEYKKLMGELEQISRLCLYQKKEWSYHRFDRVDIRKFHIEYKKLIILQRVMNHVGNLIHLHRQQLTIDSGHAKLVISAFESIKNIFNDEHCEITEDDHKRMDDLTEWLKEQKSYPLMEDGKTLYHQHISLETAIVYELLSVYDLTQELNQCRMVNLSQHTKTGD